MMSKAEKVLTKIGLSLLATAVYSAYVFAPWRSARDLYDGIVPFVLSALAIGAMCSAFRFSKPLLTAFLISAPAPAISILGALFITAALAGDGPDMSFTGVTIYVFVFSTLYSIFAVLGCMIGARIMNLLEASFSKGILDQKSETIAAARMAAVVTILASLVTLVGTISVAYIGE